MEKDYYRKGRNYEILIRKAFKSETGNRYGADQLLMVDLLVYQGQDYINSGNVLYRRRFFRVKLNIEKALVKLKKRRKYPNSHEEFMGLIVQLNNSETVDDLMDVVHGALSKMIRLENELRGIT